MTLTATQLRQNIYRILDDVAVKGLSVQLHVKGTIIKIMAERTVSKLSRLKTRNVMNGDPEEIVHADWSKEWRKQ